MKDFGPSTQTVAPIRTITTDSKRLAHVDDTGVVFGKPTGHTLPPPPPSSHAQTAVPVPQPPTEIDPAPPKKVATLDESIIPDIEGGSFVTDKRRKQLTFGEVLTQAWHEWWHNTRSSVEEVLSEMPRPTHSVPPTVTPHTERTEVIQEAAQGVAQAPRDDHAIVVEKIKQSVTEHQTPSQSPFMVKREQPIEPVTWSHIAPIQRSYNVDDKAGTKPIPEQRKSVIDLRTPPPSDNSTMSSSQKKFGFITVKPKGVPPASGTVVSPHAPQTPPPPTTGAGVLPSRPQQKPASLGPIPYQHIDLETSPKPQTEARAPLHQGDSPRSETSVSETIMHGTTPIAPVHEIPARPHTFIKDVIPQVKLTDSQAPEKAPEVKSSVPTPPVKQTPIIQKHTVILTPKKTFAQQQAIRQEEALPAPVAIPHAPISTQTQVPETPPLQVRTVETPFAPRTSETIPIAPKAPPQQPRIIPVVPPRTQTPEREPVPAPRPVPPPPPIPRPEPKKEHAEPEIAEEPRTPVINSLPRTQKSLPLPVAHPHDHAKIRIVLYALIGIFGAMLGVVTAYLFYTHVLAPTLDTEMQSARTVSNFIIADAQVPIRYSSSRTPLITEITDRMNQETKAVVQYYPVSSNDRGEEPLSAPRILEMLAPGAPSALIRSLGDGIVLGSLQTTRREPFMVLEAHNFDASFAGMLSWEATMSADLAPLFGEALTGTPFSDALAQNKSIRILKAPDGGERIIYAFVNSRYIILTTSTESLALLVERLR